MKNLNDLTILIFPVLIAVFSSCSSPSTNIKSKLVGKYASTSENEYDNFKDTIEIRSTDDGKFDIQTLANWSAAKKDDPERPNKNKKAGEWINYGPGRIKVATFQASDNTLRIADPLSSSVTVFPVDFNKKTIKMASRLVDTIVYHKIE